MPTFDFYGKLGETFWDVVLLIIYLTRCREEEDAGWEDFSLVIVVVFSGIILVLGFMHINSHTNFLLVLLYSIC